MNNVMEKSKFSIKSIINNKWIIVALLFFPFIYKVWLPSGSSIYFLDYIRDKWKLFSLLILIIMFIKRKKKPSKLLLTTLLLEIWTLIITVINNPNGIKETIVYISAVLSISLLIEIYMDDIRSLLNGLMINFEVFLYLNFITIILYHSTQGYNGAHYLLGYYNTMMIYAYPAIALAIVYMYINKKYIRSSLLIVISILTILLAGGSTPLGSLLATIFAIAIGLLIYKKNIKINHYGLLLFVIAFLFCIFILFIFEGGKFKLLDFVIEEVLHRNTTFTNRLPIWKKAEEMFISNPLGYGRETLIEAAPGWFLVHAHNTYLTVLVFTGVIGFILFMAFNILVLLNIDKQNESVIKYLFIGLLFGIFISYVTEAYQKDYFFLIIYYLAFYLNTLTTRTN